jgi:sigma-B regulation protein RsbU (phosphoserine phosphatase)
MTYPLRPTGKHASDRTSSAHDSDRELVETLFDLAREVTSVLEFDELLRKIPQLIARLTDFSVFSVYLLDERRETLKIAYAVGYPEETARAAKLKPGQGVIGTAVAEKRSIIVDDVTMDRRYRGAVPGIRSQLAVPLRHKGDVLGALNLLSGQPAAFGARDERILVQFAAHVTQALINARLFASEREYGTTLETLAEIGRDMSAILDLDALLTRIAHHVKRIIDYRTFGVALLNDETGVLEMKIGISYEDGKVLPSMKLGEGLIGDAALRKAPVVVPDVSQDPRYVEAVADVRSELVVPLLVKERCIGVFDLESPELDAFSKKHVELLTLLAAQAAVAIENARLYEALRDNEVRLEKEVHFAQRVQQALLPQDLPGDVEGVDIAWRFEAARELGGDLYDFLAPEPRSLVVAVGDVSGKGAPAALYGAFAGELVRGRTYRRRFAPQLGGPASVLASINRILHKQQLEQYYCTLCYASFDLDKRQVTIANSGLPYPLLCTEQTCEAITLPGVPLGSFPWTTYDEKTFDLRLGDIYVFCTDGISETFDADEYEFGSDRIADVVRAHRHQPAADIVAAIFDAVVLFRGDAPQTDDQTIVVVKITA